jgi:hypothetical protein
MPVVFIFQRGVSQARLVSRMYSRIKQEGQIQRHQYKVHSVNLLCAHRGRRLRQINLSQNPFGHIEPDKGKVMIDAGNWAAVLSLDLRAFDRGTVFNLMPDNSRGCS